MRGNSLVVFEARNKLVRGRAGRATHRFEDAEVARLTRQLGELPQARVATVITTYRRPEIVQRAIQSALAQTVRDQVIMVVDDAGGLPDLPQDPRISGVSLSANVAIAGVVRNMGARLTRSEYVAFLDDDNEWQPNHLETALAVLDDDHAGPPPDVVYTAVRRAFPDGRLMDVLSTPFDKRKLRGEGFMDVNSVVARRCDGLHFSRLRRPKGGTPAEDWELIFRLSYVHRQRIQHIPVQTVNYLVNPEAYWSDWQSLEMNAH
jgi:glycosyltransferase involved in cell wall biosynthesis